MPDHSAFAAEIAAAMGVLDAFMVAFNARDSEAYEATFNFPSIRLASNRLLTLEKGFHKPENFETGAFDLYRHAPGRPLGREDPFQLRPLTPHCAGGVIFFRRDRCI